MVNLGWLPAKTNFVQPWKGIGGGYKSPTSPDTKHEKFTQSKFNIFWFLQRKSWNNEEIYTD